MDSTTVLVLIGAGLLLIVVAAVAAALLIWFSNRQGRSKNAQKAAHSRREQEKDAEDEAMLLVQDLFALHQAGKLNDLKGEEITAIISKLPERYPTLSRKLMQTTLGKFLP